MLKNKNAVIYGAGGSLGGAVARALAQEGTRIFLTGRTLASLEKVKADIINSGGSAETFQLDAEDESAVNNNLDKIQEDAGSVDISFNAIGMADTQNILLVDMKMDDFLRPISIAMRSLFITSTAAARRMMKQGSGVILTLTATPGGIGYPKVGGFGPACCAIEGYVKNLASEVGVNGVRVVNMRSGGSPDSRPFVEALAADPNFTQEFLQKMKEDTMLKKMPMMADIANLAAFLCSDRAAMITGVTVDITAGTTNALNYKMPFIPFVAREHT